MRVVVLSSSSSGNSTFIELNNKKFLIDVGLGFNDIKDKLFQIGVTADELDFIIITHAHSDHVKSLHSFDRVYNTKIYISKDTLDEYPKKDILKNYIFIDDIDEIEGIKITKIPISHDKKGFGYVFDSEGISIAYMADTGMIHSRFHKYLMNKTVYLMESNHDVEMEMNGTKDMMTKIRNIGDSGHLSNDDCAKYLSMFIGDNTKYIFLIHISDHDNTHDLAYTTNRNIIDERIPIIMTYKDKISEVISL